MAPRTRPTDRSPGTGPPARGSPARKPARVHPPQGGFAEAFASAPLRHGVAWRRGLLVFAVAVLFRGAYLAEASGHPEFNLVYMDEEYHLEWAKALATGIWAPPYDQLKDQPYFRAPLYPYFLALIFKTFGVRPFLARVIQGLIGSVSCVLVYAAGSRCLGSRVGLTAGLLCACSWVLAYHDGELLLPVLEVFLMMAGLVTLLVAVERRNALIAGLAGIFFGLFAVTRPNILACLPFVVVWTYLTVPHPARATGTLLLAAGFLAPPAAVTIRNRVVGGDWVVVSSQGGVNFYIGNNAEANGIEAWVPGTRRTWWGGYEDAVAIAQRDMGRPLKPSEVSRYWMQRGLAYIADHPGAWLRLMGRKVVALIGSVEIPNNEPEEARRGRYWTLRASPVSFGLLLGLFIAALPASLCRDSARDDRDHRLRRRSMCIVVVMAGVYALTIVAFFVTGRYRVPLVPLVSIGAAATLVRLWDEFAGRRTREGLVRLGTSVVLVAALSVDYLGVRRGTAGYAMLADAQDLVEMGDYDGAIARLEEIRSRGVIRVPEVYHALAKAYLKRNAEGDRAALLGVAEDALQMHPRDPELLWYAVAGHVEAHHYDRAETWLGRYLEVKPNDMRAIRVGFGLALTRRDTARMRELVRRAEQVEDGSSVVRLMRSQLGLDDESD